MATTSLSNLKIQKKASGAGKAALKSKPSSAVHLDTHDQAQAEADQIMLDLIQGVSSENPSSMANLQGTGEALGQAAATGTTLQ